MINNNKPKLLVKTHMGMGDNIVHNGMVRKIAQDFPDYQIYTCSKDHYFKNVVYMYRDNPNITVLNVIDDNGLNQIANTANFDKIISSHFDQGNPYHYDTYFDDAFYMLIGMDPKVKTEYFYLERDYELEQKVYDELITQKGITDYVFVHEKAEYNVRIDRNKIDANLPVVVAEPQYGIFELLKVIENAKSVNLISSSFVSLMMCKKYNKNVIAHMYCDRAHISQYIKKHDIEILL
jgi:hypothetical protein